MMIFIPMDTSNDQEYMLKINHHQTGGIYTLFKIPFMNENTSLSALYYTVTLLNFYYTSSMMIYLTVRCVSDLELKYVHDRE